MISITPISIYTDNYVWLIEHTNGNAVIVDPGDAPPVLSALKEKGLTLAAILVTHHHWDHIDGINDLLKYYDVPVYGPKSKRIPHITHTVKEADQISLFSDASVILKTIEVPGHTTEHIAYFGQVEGHPTLFSGDTLFAGGCGRLLDESTHEHLCHSLQRLNQLPENTQIYCTHEYTMANLAFAKAVEPNNSSITDRIKNEQIKRAQNIPTVPTSLTLERQTNPFLRCEQAAVAMAVNQHWQSNWSKTEDLFGGLRSWKDNF